MRGILPLLATCLLATLATGALAQDLYDLDTVRDIKLTFSQPDWWQDLWVNYQTETLMEVDMEVDGQVYTSVGVRFKGGTSATHVWPYEKMPFKIKTDEFVADQTLYGYDNLNLSNCYHDPTFVREVTAYEIMRRYMPAPKANFICLWLNNTYWGIYVNVQQLDGDFIDEWYSDEDGNRYKAVDGSLTYNGTAPASYQSAYELHSDGNGQEWYDLIGMIDELNNGNAQLFHQNLEPVLNLDQALWYLAACNLLGNLDSYLQQGHNYYLYTHYGRFEILPVDWNLCFAQYRNASGGSPAPSIEDIQELDPFYNLTPDHPLLEKLLTSNSAAGPERYMAHHRALFQAEFDWPLLEPRILGWQTLIEQDVINDTKKLYSLQNFYDNVYDDLFTTGSEIIECAGLRTFVQNRRTFLLNHSEYQQPQIVIDQISTSPASPGFADPVQVTARISVSTGSLDSAEVLYRPGEVGIFLSATLYDDGLHGDGAAADGTWGGQIPAQPGGSTVYYYLAACAPGVRQHAPVEAEFAPDLYHVALAGNSVLINEFLAKNDTGIQDEMGEYEDWVELYNTTASLIDLSGAYLTDDLTDLTKWQIPASTFIDPFSTLLIWTDDDAGDGPLHTTFKLSADGEEIALVDTDGSTLLDSIVFGAQEADISTGRLFDGLEPWVTFPSPSPEALNAPGTTGFRTYSALDSTVQTLSLEGTGTPALTQPVVFETRDGPLNSYIVLFICRNSDYAPIDPSGTVLLVGLPWMQIHFHPTNGAGAADHNITLPNKPSLVGKAFYLQSLTDANGFIEGSNGLEMVVGQ